MRNFDDIDVYIPVKYLPGKKITNPRRFVVHKDLDKIHEGLIDRYNFHFEYSKYATRPSVKQWKPDCILTLLGEVNRDQIP